VRDKVVIEGLLVIVIVNVVGFELTAIGQWTVAG
jgi:hypothetical protein